MQNLREYCRDTVSRCRHSKIKAGEKARALPANTMGDKSPKNTDKKKKQTTKQAAAAKKKPQA